MASGALQGFDGEHLAVALARLGQTCDGVAFHVHGLRHAARSFGGDARNGARLAGDWDDQRFLVALDDDTSCLHLHPLHIAPENTDDVAPPLDHDAGIADAHGMSTEISVEEGAAERDGAADSEVR